MTNVQGNDIIKSFLEYLYSVLMGGSDKIPPSPDTFITFCSPGIPFGNDSFDFAFRPLSSAKDTAETNKLIMQMCEFAQLVDFIPDFNAFKDKMAPYQTSQMRLSEMYRQILKASKIVDYKLTPDEDKKLKKVQEYLQKPKLFDENPFDDIPGEMILYDSAEVVAYKEKERKCNDARERYINKWIDAQTLTGDEGKRATLLWSRMGQTYFKEYTNALDDWRAAGYKNIVELAYATINQLTEKSMVLWKERLQKMILQHEQQVPTSMIDFLTTTLIPSNFTSQTWQKYSFSKDTYNRKRLDSETKWKAGAAFSMGIFSIGGSASGKKETTKIDIDIDSFKLTFDLCMTTIIRPWFYPEWFANRGWDLPQKGTAWTWDKRPSNGNITAPDGVFIAYPTTAIFARNIKITSKEINSKFDAWSKTTSGGGGFSIGPFRIGGGGGSSTSGSETHFKKITNGIESTGIQLIGYVNRLIPKAPNLLPTIKQSDLV